MGTDKRAEKSNTIKTAADMLNVFNRYSGKYDRSDNYSVNVNNIITGVQCCLWNNNERVMLLEISNICNKNKNTTIYLEDCTSEKTVYKTLILNNLIEICEIAARNNFSFKNGIKLGSIGRYYKPVNNSPVQEISGSNISDLLNLLQFLQDRGFLKINNSQEVNGRFEDVLDEWNSLPEI